MWPDFFHLFAICLKLKKERNQINLKKTRFDYCGQKILGDLTFRKEGG